MEDILRCFIREGNAEMIRQIEFIIKQLNSGLFNPRVYLSNLSHMLGRHTGFLRAAPRGLGVPVVVQWKQIRLASVRMRVRSLASTSGLGIWHCRELGCRSQMLLGSGVAVAVV